MPQAPFLELIEGEIVISSAMLPIGGRVILRTYSAVEAAQLLHAMGPDCTPIYGRSMSESLSHGYSLPSAKIDVEVALKWFRGELPDG